MTKKYTAADFANARFAEHESGQAVAIRWTQDHASEPDGFWTYERPLNNKFSKEATHQEMADMDGWVPVPTKPQITESDYSDLTEWARTWALSGWRGRQVLANIGIEVIPDPEPTNAEKIEELIREAGINYDGAVLYGDRAIKAWAEYLDNNNVYVKDN